MKTTIPDASYYEDGGEPVPDHLIVSEPDAAELQRQNAALKAFVKTVVRQSWEFMELNGGDVQELAESHDVLSKKVADESDVVDGSDYSIGDDIFVFAPWMLIDAAMPVPSRAQIAREFLDELYGTGLSAEVLALIMRKVWEWEAAEEKC